VDAPFEEKPTRFATLVGAFMASMGGNIERAALQLNISPNIFKEFAGGVI